MFILLEHLLNAKNLNLQFQRDSMAKLIEAFTQKAPMLPILYTKDDFEAFKSEDSTLTIIEDLRKIEGPVKNKFYSTLIEKQTVYNNSPIEFCNSVGISTPEEKIGSFYQILLEVLQNLKDKDKQILDRLSFVMIDPSVVEQKKIQSVAKIFGQQIPSARAQEIAKIKLVRKAKPEFIFDNQFNILLSHSYSDSARIATYDSLFEETWMRNILDCLLIFYRPEIDKDQLLDELLKEMFALHEIYLDRIASNENVPIFSIDLSSSNASA